MSTTPLIQTRFESFQKLFWTDEMKEKIDAVIIATRSKAESENHPYYTIDDSIFFWLCQITIGNGYMVIEHDKITIFVHSNDYDLLSEYKHIPIITLTPCPNDDQNKQAVSLSLGKRIGTTTIQFDNDDFSELDKTDVQSDLEKLLIVHENVELTRERNAGKIAGRVLSKVLVPRLEEIINNRESETCSELSRIVNNEMNKPDLINLKFKSNDVQPAFPVAISTGDKVDISYPPTCVGRISSDIVCTTVGVRFKGYVGSIGRTFFINATAERKAAYKSLLKAREAAINTIDIGVAADTVYTAFINALDEKYRSYAGDSLGFFSGIQVKTENHGIFANSPDTIENNSVLVISATLSQVPDPAGNFSFNLILTDTVQVTEEGTKIITASPFKFKDVAYELNITDDKTVLEDILNDKTIMADRTRTHNKDKKKMNEEELEMQKKLLQEFKRSKPTKLQEEAQEDTVINEISYEKPSDLPTLRQSNTVQIHQEHKSVFFPFFGIMVPFNICVIKTAASEMDDDGNISFLRITFEIPKPSQVDLKQLYIRELMFQAKGSQKFEEIAKKIREVKTKYNTILKRRKDEKDIYQNEKFEQLKDQSAPRIGGNNLQIRPAITGKKNVGSLEAHQNGFRYKSSSGDTIYVMYRNIRLAIFQPSENEINTYIHFYMHKPIKIANKPTFHVTFFKQVVENSVDVSMRSSAGLTDQAEFAEEERERKIRKKINKEFREFCKAVSALNIQTAPNFEKPQRRLGFRGVPFKSFQLIIPTFSALVSLSDTQQQPFVLMRDDIEIAVFERMTSSTQSFELTFILNEWDEKENRMVQISQIHVEDFEVVKSWLNVIEIKYYQVKQTIDWKTLLTQLRKQGREQFLNSNGWDGFFEEEEETDEESPVFDPDDDEFTGDEDDDDEMVDAADEDDDDEAPEDEDSEDGGLTWNQLEEKNREYDRRHADRFSDDEPVHKTKKHRRH